MKFRAYVIFFLLFGVLSDLYTCLLFLPLLWDIILCIPTLAALVCLFFIGAGVQYTPSLRIFSYLIFIFEFPKFIFMLFSSIGIYLLGIPRGPGAWIAFGVGAGVSLFFSYLIFYSTRHLKVHSQELAFEGLPKEFDGLRICQLTDFHLGSFGKKAKYITRIVDTTMSLKPDVILFTGDLVNFEAAEAESYLEVLARLSAPYGVFAIRGNHDYLLHGHHNEEERKVDTEKLHSMETGLGWTVLLNENILLKKDGASIALVGVENVSSNPYFLKMGGDLKKAMEGLPEGIFIILLSHDPSHWRREVVPSSDIPLTLSGHTHGLKYKLAGLKPSHWKLPESSGIYTEGAQVLHVSKGLGSAFAFRLGGFPNIDIITLRTKTL